MLKYLFALLIFISSTCLAQEVGTYNHDTTCIALKLTKKGNPIKVRKRMDTYSSTGFYLFLNYYYSFSYRGNEKYFISKIIRISKDSLSLTNDFDETMATINKHTYDTITIAFDELEKIKLTRDEFLGIREKVSLKDYDKELIQTSKCYESPIRVNLLSSPTIGTECYAYCAGSNIYYCYQKEGRIYKSTIIYYGDGK